MKFFFKRGNEGISYYLITLNPDPPITPFLNLKGVNTYAKQMIQLPLPLLLFLLISSLIAVRFL